MTIKVKNTITVVRVNDGKGIAAMRTLFYKSNSKTTKPTKPESPTKLNNWSTNKPNWKADTYIWTTTEITYENPTRYEYTEPECDTSWEAVNDVKIGGTNLIVLKNKTDGYYLEANGSHTNSINYSTSDYILVKPYSTYITSGYTNLGKSPATCFYDSDKNYISGIANDNWVNKVTPDTIKLDKRRVITAPSNCCYIRVSFLTSDSDVIKFELGNKPTDWSPAPEDIQAQIDGNISKLNDISADNKLTPSEKQAIYTEWLSIEGEYSKYSTQCSTYNVSITAYNSAYNTLKSYLMDSNTGCIYKRDTTTTIIRDTFNLYFKNYYNTKTDMTNALEYAKAHTEAGKVDEKVDKIVSGTTTIMGGLVSTDCIKSNNYTKDNAGSKLNLIDGSFDSKYTKWDKDGKMEIEGAKINGDVTAESFSTETYGFYKDGISIADGGSTYRNRSAYITHKANQVPLDPSTKIRLNLSAYGVTQPDKEGTTQIVDGVININGGLEINTKPLIDIIYPIGSIYISMNNLSPQAFIGGVWEQIKDKFLLSASSTYAANSTGGSATVTLDSTQIPSHKHSVNIDTTTTGSHHHGMYLAQVGGSGTSKWTPATKNDKTATSVREEDAGSHKHNVSGYTGSTGDTKSHNNMPPYLAVYMWKRVV